MAEIAPDRLPFKEVFFENTHLADSRRQVKKYIIISTPRELSGLRRFHCPRIAYENRLCPDDTKTHLSADDIALRRYKYVPVAYPSEQERKRLLRKRQRQQQRLVRPRYAIPKASKDEDNEEDGDQNSPKPSEEEGDPSSSPRLPTPEVPQLTTKSLKVMRKWQKKALTMESDNDSDDDDNTSQVSGEYKDFLIKKNKSRVLGTPDFETDMDSVTDNSETEVFYDAKGRRRKKKFNQTVKMYHRSCARCHMTPVKSFVRQCGKATIDIRHRMLTYRDAKPIAITLVNDKKTSFLDISFNPLGTIGTSSIAQMLSTNKTLVELNLSSTFPQRQGLESLLMSLGHNNILRRLYLNDNELLPSDGEVLAQFILNLPNLLELHIANNNMGFEGTTAITKALCSTKGKLNVLNLSYNNIRTTTAVQLAMALVKNKTLRSLDVSWNGFGAEGGKAIGLALEKNNTLKDLDLTCNRLGIKTLDTLIQGLTKNKGLLCIRIGSNPLTTEGLKALITALSASKTCPLTELDVRGIPVDQEFFEIKNKLVESRTIRVHHDNNIHLGTTDLTRETDGTFLDNYDPSLVMYEFMKKDNLRVIDFFQFFDVRQREKLSKGDLATGFSTLMIPFTHHQIDMIMKKLDLNKDGFISIDEMMKGYSKCDKIVKLRRIKASKNKTKDEGLENLWVYLKSLIVKRKEENTKKTADKVQARRNSLLPGAVGSLLPGAGGSLLPGAGGKRDSLKPGGGDGSRRGSLLPGGGDGRRGSIIAAAGSDDRRGSADAKWGSLLSPWVGEARRGSMKSSSDGNKGISIKIDGVENGTYSRRGSESKSRIGSANSTTGSDKNGSAVVGQPRPEIILEAEGSMH